MKINWVEINLPWRPSTYPIGNDKLITSLKEKEDALFKAEEKAIYLEAVRETGYSIEKLASVLDENVQKKVVEKYGNNYTSEQWVEILNDVYSYPLYKRLRQYREFSDRKAAWNLEQPEYKEFEQDLAAQRLEIDSKSFTGRKLNKPGTLIEFKESDSLSQYLIGHINTSGGVCNDCMGFNENTIIIRYAILIPFPEESYDL